jgi:hypothetical protein
LIVLRLLGSALLRVTRQSLSQRASCAAVEQEREEGSFAPQKFFRHQGSLCDSFNQTEFVAYPVLRGTALILDEKNAYLWTNGYVPQLATYIGPEAPNPLFITLLRSKHPMPKIESVLSDIIGLTKINYNSCNYNDSLPITVQFARMIGEVLTMGSAKGSEKQPFKFYV